MIVPAIFLSLAAVMTPAGPAPSGAPRMIVRTDDLNLTSERGAAALRRRMDEAVLTMAADRGSSGGSFPPDPALRAARIAAGRQADGIIEAARGHAGTDEPAAPAKAPTAGGEAAATRPASPRPASV